MIRDEIIEPDSQKFEYMRNLIFILAAVFIASCAKPVATFTHQKGKVHSST